MKLNKIILLVAVFATSTIGINAAEINKTSVPQVVLDAFAKKYPTATETEWEKDGNNYEAEFKLNGTEYEAEYTATGEWKETETEIGEKELPSTVSAAFTARFPGARIKEVEKVESAKSGMVYEIEYRKGMHKKEVTFDASGNLLSEDED